MCAAFRDHGQNIASTTVCVYLPKPRCMTGNLADITNDEESDLQPSFPELHLTLDGRTGWRKGTGALDFLF